VCVAWAPSAARRRNHPMLLARVLLG
jgi:hypothetical protein